MPVHTFLASSISVHFNAVKNIIFRAAAIALYFFLYRLLSFITYKTRDYTTFLMFGEDIIQKSFFIISRRLNRQAILALIFTVLCVGAGFYDTLLWSLDFPGYVTRSQLVPASSLSSQMVESPPYLIRISAPLHGLDQIDLSDTMGAALYNTGVNTTLPGIVELGSKQIIPTHQPLSEFVGPRVRLDEGGFAVAVDSGILFMSANNESAYCIPRRSAYSNLTQVWKCPIERNDTLEATRRYMGQVQIWWDDDHSQFLTPDRKDNPWLTYGAGGGTALMRQVFVVSKGFRRHTFLETHFKTTMTSEFPSSFDDEELTDFMRRTWSTGPEQPLTPGVQTLANLVIAAKNNQTSLMFGTFTQAEDGYSGYSTSTKYLTIFIQGEPSPYYSTIQFSSTNFTLVRSETLNQQRVPSGPCGNRFYSKQATGGVVHSTTCFESNATDQRGQFLGQIDTSAVVIINDILGDGSSNSSSVALNQTGVNWYNQNFQHLENLLLSRGIILGGDRTTVKVAVAHNEAAISHLQLLLIAFPFSLALIIWGVTFGKGMSYYKSSFFAAVVRTTHVGSEEGEGKCARADYIRCPPELELRENEGHVVIGTPQGGLIAHVCAVVRQNEHVRDFEPEQTQLLGRY